MSPPPSRVRRILRIAARSGVVLTVLLAALYLLRGPLFGGMVARSITDALADALGGSYSLDAVEGGWLSDAVLVGLRTDVPPPTGELRELAFDRARVDYGLRALLRDPLRALRRVHVEGLRVVIDADPPRGPPREGPGPSFAEVLESIPRPLPEMDVRGSLLVRSAGGDWDAARLHLHGGGTSLRLEVDGLADPLSEAGERGALRGAVEWAEPGDVRWTSESEIAGVTVASVVARAGPGRAWAIDAGLRVAGGTIDAEVREEGFRATARAVDLARVPPWIRALAGESAAGVPQQGTVEFEIGGTLPGDEPVSLRGRLAAQDLAWRGRAIDRLVVEAAWEPPRLSVASLEASGDGARVTARGVVLVPESPLVVETAEVVTAGVADAGAFAVRLGLDEVAGRLPQRPTSITVRLRGPEPRRVVIEEMVFDAGTTHIDASGSIALPEDPMRWREAVADGEVRARLDLGDVRRALPAAAAPSDAAGVVLVTARVRGALGEPAATLTVEGSGLTLGGQRIDRVSADAALAKTLLTVTRAEFASSFATATVTGEVDLDTLAVRDASAEAVASDLAALSLAFRLLPSLSGAGRVSVSAAGAAPDGLRGDVRVDATDLAVGDWPIGTVALAGSFDGTAVRVDRLEASGRLGSVSASGTADLRARSLDLPSFRAAVPDLAEIDRRLPDPIDMAGAVEVEGGVRIPDDARWRDAEGDLQVHGIDVSIGGARAATLAVRTRATGRRFDLQELAASGDWGALAAEAGVEFGEGTTHATVRRLRLVRGAVDAALTAPALVTWGGGSVEVERFDARVGGGSLRGAAHLTPETLTADLEATGVDLGVFTDRATGAVTARLEARGDARAPDVRLSFEVPSALWDGERVTASGALVQDERGIRLEKLLVDGGELLTIHGEGYAPFRVGTTGVVEPDSPPPATLSLRLVSASPDHWLDLVTDEPLAMDAIDLRIDGKGRDLDAQLRLRELRWAGGGLDPVRLPGDTVLDVRVRSEGTTVHAETAPGGTIVLLGDARTPAAPDWTHPAGARDALRGAAIAGKVSLEVTDLSAALRWFKGIRHLEGRAHAEVTVGGTVDDPSWTGVVEASDVALLVPGDLPPIDRGDARLRVEGRRVHVERFTGRLGYAPFGAEGFVDLPYREPAFVDLRLRGENVLLVRSHHFRLRADVDIAAKGEFETLAISGTARVTRALYTRPMDLLGRGAASPDRAFQLFSVRNPPFDRATFDVAVSADRTVRVDNDLVSADLALELTLRGTGEVPEPVGTVTFHGATVSLPFTTLDVERGVLAFQPGNPFAPEVRAFANAHVKGYDLFVALSGNLPDVDVHVASSPPLSQQSARLLLATGATPEELEREGIAGAALTRAGTLLGGEALSWVAGRTGRRGESLLDRVRVEVGREESEAGVETVTAEFRMAPRWYLVAERDRFEDYNLGVVWRVRFK